MKMKNCYDAPSCKLCAADIADVIAVSAPHFTLEDIDDIVKDDFAILEQQN